MKKDRPTSAHIHEAATSWGGVTEWYSNYLEHTQDSYQRQVILPNLLRVLALRGGERVLDVACGQGFFTRALSSAGAKISGVDISKTLIDEARTISSTEIPFHVAAAHRLFFAKDGSHDAVTIILAVQNIEHIAEVFAEVNRILVHSGRMVLVMMHPAFRVPKASFWGWDEEMGVQYRRVDSYLTPHKSQLEVHPGRTGSEVTTSYHRSLQDFSKALAKGGFVITKMEEWISHKKSQEGPRQIPEDTARREIPLFLMLEAKKT